MGAAGIRDRCLLACAEPHRPARAALLVPWLLFFPNAPYLLTHFIHLGEGPAPLWYDTLMLSAFAWTGLLLGFGSLYRSDDRCSAFGETIAWLGVLAALGLAAVGVYVGRFIGLNSGDAILHPVRLADVIREQFFTVPGRTVEALLALVAFLLVGYLAVYSFTGLNLELERARRQPDAARLTFRLPARMTRWVSHSTARAVLPGTRRAGGQPQPRCRGTNGRSGRA